MGSEAKRRKIHQPPPRRTVTSSDSNNDKASTSTPTSLLQGQIGGVNFGIQQDKNSAVAQAQQDGCTGNYRIFDSLFGNFLVPVIPTRADLEN